MIVHMVGHKNSKGLDAPWVVKSEDGKILSSHSSKSKAQKHLYHDIEGHKKKASQQIIAYHGSKLPVLQFDTRGIIWFSEDKDKILNGDAGAGYPNYLITVELNVKNTAGYDEYEKYFLDQLEQEGYDSVYFENDWIIFSPDSIKILSTEKINKKASLEPVLDDVKKQIIVFFRMQHDLDKNQLIDAAVKKFNISFEDGEICFTEAYPNGLSFITKSAPKTCSCTSDETCNCTAKKHIHSNIEKVIENIKDFDITDEFIEDLYHVVEKKENIDSIVDKYKIKNDAFVLVLYSLLEELHDIISKTKEAGFLDKNTTERYFNGWYNSLIKEYFNTEDLEQFKTKYKNLFHTVFDKYCSENDIRDKQTEIASIRTKYAPLIYKDIVATGRQSDMDRQFLSNFIRNI